jgi:hypothetical protein
VLAVLCLTLVSCGESKKSTKPEPEGPYLPGTTLSNVIHNLKQAYIDQDYDGYAALFDGDYRFLRGTSSTWSLGDELDVHHRMFGGEPNGARNYVTDIHLAFTENEPDIDPAFPDLSRVILSAVDLRVDTRNLDDGDVTLLLTPAGTQVHLYFVLTDETDPRSGDRLWKIRAWKEVTPGGVAPGTETSTWSEIKALWQGRYRPLTTITNGIANLKAAYVDRNHDEYAKLFTEDFQFLFDPSDTAVPDSWPIADELEAARNMFTAQANLDGSAVEGIALAFSQNEPDVDPEFPDYARVVLSGVDLRVDSRNVNNQDVTLYFTPPGTREWFYFVQTEETDPRSGNHLWKIRLWKDLGAGVLRPATKTTTWGRIKANWRGR